jgi:hypothetical protein
LEEFFFWRCPHVTIENWPKMKKSDLNSLTKTLKQLQIDKRL